jgi:hypothetical protein
MGTHFLPIIDVARKQLVYNRVKKYSQSKFVSFITTWVSYVLHLPKHQHDMRAWIKFDKRCIETGIRSVYTITNR